MIDRFKRLSGVLLGLLVVGNAVAGSLIVGDQSYNNRAVMEAAGVLDDVPYDIQWRQFTAGSPVAEALNVSSLDLGLLGDAPPLFLGALGAPIKVIAVSRQNLASVAILVRKDSPITSLTQLEGKRAAIWKGSWSQQLLLSALDHAGVPRTSLDIRYLSALDASHALDSGAVDVIATWEPYVTQQQRQGARVLATAEGLMAAQSFVVANAQMIEPKQALIADFLRRLQKARNWALQGTAENQRYAQVWSGYSRADQTIAETWFARAHTQLEAVSAQSIEDAQQTVDFFSDLGLIKRYSAASLFDSRFNSALAP